METCSTPSKTVLWLMGNIIAASEILVLDPTKGDFKNFCRMWISCMLRKFARHALTANTAANKLFYQKNATGVPGW